MMIFHVFFVEKSHSHYLHAVGVIDRWFVALLLLLLFDRLLKGAAHHPVMEVASFVFGDCFSL